VISMHEKALTELVEKLRKAFAQRLVSVVLYGSAATGDHHARFSDLNVLCVLDEITPRELAACGDIFRWWRESGNPAPLLLSERELAESTDCFAIEFHDIQAHHRLLDGRDVISLLAVDDSFYRAQVEHDLRAKLLRLRQKAAGVMHDSGLLRALLLDSVSNFCVLFRHALALHGAGSPARQRETVDLARAHFGFDSAPFEQLLNVREGQVKPRDLDAAALLGPYLEGISAVIGAVDRLAK
jgi:Nucleotidyltransferase domain